MYYRTLTHLSFPLLDLPAELRNHIYQFVFSGGCIHVCRRSNPHARLSYPGHWSKGDKYARSITQVCRQTRHESLGMYFNSYNFVLQIPSIFELKSWLKKRIRCQHYRAALNEVAIFPYRKFPRTEMGRLVDQLEIIFDFASYGLDRLVSLEAMMRPIRRAALAMRKPPSSSLLDTCITEAFRLGMLTKHAHLNKSERRAAFRPCFASLDRDMLHQFFHPYRLYFIEP